VKTGVQDDVDCLTSLDSGAYLDLDQGFAEMASNSHFGLFAKPSILAKQEIRFELLESEGAFSRCLKRALD